ncbi:hypothetical protein HRbin40_01089 [bacterium HR40]|nr:hypothetical protein HRbin40_01089 [bacterium HR40]
MSRSLSFWPSDRLDLLAHDDTGRLRLTDAWLLSWLDRPELALAPESCAAERQLHAALTEDPRCTVGPAAVAAIRDPDVRENWQLFLAFRDHLLAHGTIDEAWAALFRTPHPPVAPPFVDALARLLVHDMLRTERDAFVLRAAEMFFRPQRASVQNGRVLVADAETVERLARGEAFGRLGTLLRETGIPLQPVELDVLDEERASDWFSRSERFDFVLDLGFGGRGLDALCRVLERWVVRLFGIEVAVQPLARIRDERWRWHLGLDGEATAILNDLYAGREVSDERLARLVALFRLDFRDPEVVRPEVRGFPVYMGLAMDAGSRVRLKPQNLLVNLPLVRAA